MQEMPTCPLGICPHYSSCWECCLQMALSCQPPWGAASGEEAMPHGHTPYLGHMVCVMTVECLNLAGSAVAVPSDCLAARFLPLPRRAFCPVLHNAVPKSPP